MSREAGIAVVAGIIVLGLVVIVGLGAFGTTVTTVDSGPAVSVDYPPADGSAGIVFDLSDQPGQSIFGINLSASKYYAHVGMVVPESCIVEDADGLERLRDDLECANLPLHGELVGGGTTSEGGRLAIVRHRIARACFDVVERGDTWPTPHEACQP